MVLRWAAIVVLAAGLTVLAVTLPTSSAPLVVGLTLDKVVVKAGEQIHGQLSITNTTRRPIQAPDAETCNGLVRVGLTNAQVTFEPAFHLMGCAGAVLEPGTTKVPITIDSTYQSCTQGPASPGHVSCVSAAAGIMPPLPAGTYEVAIVFNWYPPPKMQLPARTLVTIRG